MNPDYEVAIINIARVCHEANAAWCRINGDDSQKPWDQAEERQRQHTVENVEAALAGTTPEQRHIAWRESKERNGWICGEFKDAEARTHPFLVDYDQLPPEQRAKDAIFIGIVQTLAPPLGLMAW